MCFVLLKATKDVQVRRTLSYVTHRSILQPCSILVLPLLGSFPPSPAPPRLLLPYSCSQVRANPTLCCPISPAASWESHSFQPGPIPSLGPLFPPKSEGKRSRSALRLILGCDESDAAAKALRRFRDFSRWERPCLPYAAAMLLLKASRAACRGAEGAGPAAPALSCLMGSLPQGPEEGSYLGHRAQRGLVQSQHQRAQVLQSL